MESIHEEMKMFIDLNLPDKKEELIWIVNNIGKKIYDDTNEWKTNNIYQNEKELYPNSFNGIIRIIDKIILDNSSKDKLVKYLYCASLIKLNSILI